MSNTFEVVRWPASITCTVNSLVPAWVGVPEIIPAADSVRPAGRPPGLGTQAYGVNARGEKLRARNGLQLNAIGARTHAIRIIYRANFSRREGGRGDNLVIDLGFQIGQAQAAGINHRNS